MNARLARQLLDGVAGACLAAAGGLALVAWQLPYARPRVEASRPAVAPGRKAAAERPPSAAAFEGLWDRPLRGPLYDAAPPPPPPAAPPPPVRLAGTIVEPGRSWAMILMPGGTTELLRVGDTSGGVEVLEIAKDRVTIRYGGGRVVLVAEDAEKR